MQATFKYRQSYDCRSKECRGLWKHWSNVKLTTKWSRFSQEKCSFCEFILNRLSNFVSMETSQIILVIRTPFMMMISLYSKVALFIREINCLICIASQNRASLQRFMIRALQTVARRRRIDGLRKFSDLLKVFGRRNLSKASTEGNEKMNHMIFLFTCCLRQ